MYWRDRSFSSCFLLTHNNGINRASTWVGRCCLLATFTTWFHIHILHLMWCSSTYFAKAYGHRWWMYCRAILGLCQSCPRLQGLNYHGSSGVSEHHRSPLPAAGGSAEGPSGRTGPAAGLQQCDAMQMPTQAEDVHLHDPNVNPLISIGSIHEWWLNKNPISMRPPICSIIYTYIYIYI